jgi:hypothetical protein
VRFSYISHVYYVVKTDRAQTAVAESYMALCNRPGGGWYLDYTPHYDGTFSKTAPGDLLKTPDIVPSALPAPQIKIEMPRDEWIETRSGDGGNDIGGIADNLVKETCQPNLPAARQRELGYTKVTVTVDSQRRVSYPALQGVDLRLQIANVFGATIFAQKHSRSYGTGLNPDLPMRRSVSAGER